MITKNLKRVITIALSVMAILMFAIAATGTKKVKATAENGFYMTDGAYVSLSENYGGIRWKTNVTQEWLNEKGDSSLVFGTLVAPNVNPSDLDFETVNVVNIVAGNISDSLYFYSAISYDSIFEEFSAVHPEATEAEVLKAAYALELTARSYVLVDGEVEWAEANDTTRSARQVANVAVLNGAVDEDDVSEAVKDRVSGYVGTATRDESSAYYYIEENNNIETEYDGNGSEIVIGAKRFAGSVSQDGVITLEGGQNVPSGENWISIFHSNGVYSKPIVSVTKVIKEAEDLAIFNAYKADASSAYTGNVIDGYYMLGNNIDASDYTHKKSAGDLTSFDIKKFKANFDGYGFKGVFDGNGYAINNLTTTENGLFGVINGGTVKNVALTNVKRVTEYSQAPIIAGLAIGATVENVYASTTAGIQNGAIFLDILETTIKNSVFEVTGNVSSNRATWGSLTRTATERGFTSSTFDEVYVLSDRVLTHYNNNNKDSTKGKCYEVDAVNRTDAWLAEQANDTYRWWNPTTTNVAAGIYRYNDRNDMMAANLEYSLDETYWDISSGAPEFKDLPTKTTGTVINMFSAYDGDIDLTEAFGAQKTQTVVLLSATQDDVPLTVSDGKILGVKPVYVLTKGKITGVDYAVVKLTGTVDGTEVTTVVAIKAYTRVIDEASDMLMFKDDIATNSNDLPIKGKPFDGYYILSKNLDMTASDVNAAYFTSFTGNLDGRNQAKNIEETVGLTGVFDGNGYSIKNMKAPKSGLFGVVNGGTVKNVAFVDVDIENSYSAAIAAHLKNAVIENVYISTANLREKTKNCQTAPGWFDSYNSTISNVLIEVKKTTEYIYSSSSTTPNTKGYGSLSAFSGECFAKWTEVNVYKNVYVIAKDKLSDDGRGTTLDGENCAKATKNLVGVRRYESEAAMKADTENDYTPFGSLWEVNDNRLTWKGKA